MLGITRGAADALVCLPEITAYAWFRGEKFMRQPSFGKIVAIILPPRQRPPRTQ
jgi:hypothetical protein